MRRSCNLQPDICNLHLNHTGSEVLTDVAEAYTPAAPGSAGVLNCRRLNLSAICLLHLSLCISQLAFAQQDQAAPQPPAPQPKPAAQERLFDRTPFDQVILNQAGGGTTLDVITLTLPQRPLAAIPQTGSLKVRLLKRPTEDFEVAWSNVASVRIFEQVLLDEAQRLTAAKKFDDAYDYYARLQADYPNLPGLNDAVCDYLRQNAIVLYQNKQYDRALALLLTLYEKNPAFPTLPNALEAVAGEVIQQYLRDGDYASARRVLDLWRKEFKDIATQGAATWQQRFEAAATKQVSDATQLVEQRKYIPARKTLGRALAIWPDLASARQVMERIEREFPFVAVGVFETSPRQPVRRFDDWASIRTSKLTGRMLAEPIDFGSEGGTYGSTYGQWDLDDTGRELTLKANSTNEAGGPTPDALVRFLLSMAAPGSATFRSDIASLIDAVSLQPDRSIVLHLNRVHVRPESLLQLSLPTSIAPTGLYSIADYSRDMVMFSANNGANGPQAIVEQTFPSDDSAITALLGGEIDVLDRIPPWQLERLRSLQNLHIESYKLPTVHVLIPNLSKPLLAKREFRRALCFGIDRKWIVDRVILGGNPAPGIVPISGPFPAGTSLNDPISYAYNNQIAPRSFEPRLATILSTVAWSSVQNPPDKSRDKKPGDDPAAKKAKEQMLDVKIPELILAHPSDPIARVACQSIQAQLAREDIPVKLVEFTADELQAGKVEYDLRYAELAVWEPVADAQRILGAGGLAGDLHSPYLNAALRNLDTATNWKDVRLRLGEIHEIASHELPVIPLWQTINYFAYHTQIRGLGDTPVTLYQNVEQWSTAPGNKVASAERLPPKQ
jgi:ABC-type transport system substrate-binding protein